MQTTHTASRSMRRITYYAMALNDDGRVAQFFVVRENGRQVSLSWTGVVYHDEREADRDITRLNCGR
jgi:hypothetical protein